MKTNELRLGNWVHDGSRFPMQVVGIFDNDVYLDFEGNEGDVWECGLEGAKPFEIDQEWLIKFGFEEDGPDWYYLSTKDRFTNIGYSYSVNKNIFEVNEWEVVNVKYVHQLQNLYFALTGEEL